MLQFHFSFHFADTKIIIYFIRKCLAGIKIRPIFAPAITTMARVLSSVGSEHLVYTQRVGGSTPSGPTRRKSQKGFLFYFHHLPCLFLPEAEKRLKSFSPKSRELST